VRPAEVYDLLNPWDASDEFYLELVMASRMVVDIGCGTGTLLHRARTGGHVGRLVGVDPDPDMLAVARATSDDVEWVRATAAEVGAVGADLVVMTGHAFQTLVTDDDIATSLQAIRRALIPGGRFAFETRNPRATPWLRWDGETLVNHPTAGVIRLTRRVREATSRVVTFDETFSGAGIPDAITVSNTLRFCSRSELTSLLGDAGFAIAEQYGDWSRSPVTASSPEIITIAIAR
jgi:SAM-dependent methyltransferase